MKYKFFAIFICGILFSLCVNTAQTNAFDFKEKSGLKETGIATGHTETGNVEKSIDTTIGGIIQAVMSFLGIIFLILMIYGGFLWMTAKGNEEQVTKAKNLIIAAIIGIIIVVSAYAITYFVLVGIGDETMYLE